MDNEKKDLKKDVGSKARTGSEIAPQPKPRVETEPDGAFPTYCYMCNSGGPDVINVRVKSGIPINLEPNYNLSYLTPFKERGWRPCSMSMQMIYRHFNPNRVKAPMKRTNPKKGRNEDPRFVEISWDEALDSFVKKLLEVKEKGWYDENGYYRIATCEGSDGTCPSFNGTYAVLFGGNSTSIGFPMGIFPADYTLGHGGGTKCYHTEHILGELWNKSFVCGTDHPRCKLIVSYGRSEAVASGVHASIRTADARVNGAKRIQIEPVLTTTGALAKEWVPIKPGTDAAFIYALIHHVLHELDWQQACDVPFLKQMTNNPYLVAPNGYYIRDSQTKKAMIWDSVENRARVWDDPEIKDYALDGEFTVSGLTIGADEEEIEFTGVKVKPVFVYLREHVKKNTPEWAAVICDVPAKTIRRVADEMVNTANAAGKATINMFGMEMPLRPVSGQMGRGINEGRGSVSAVWGNSTLLTLLGAFEVPGGLVGTIIHFSGPLEPKTFDGFAHFPFNPTSKEKYKQITGRRDCGTGLCPMTCCFYGPLHISYKNVVDGFPNWPKASPPDVFVTYKVNLPISQHDPPMVEETLKRIPFMVSFVHTIDENSWFADLILPEDCDFETLQLFPTGGTKDHDVYWEQTGIAIKQPIVKRLYNTLNITDIMTEIAARAGILPEYNAFINRGDWLGFELDGTPWALESDKKYSAEEIYDRIARVVSTKFSGGKVTQGLEDFKKTGGFFWHYPQDEVIRAGKSSAMCIRPWFLYPVYKKKKMRFELPYQERLKKIHIELKRRLHERNIFWWDEQCDEIDFLPPCEIVGDVWDKVIPKVYGKKAEDYPFWILSTKSGQQPWGLTMCLPQVHELTKQIMGHEAIQMNKKAAQKLGIKDGDEIWVESPYRRMKGKVMLREGIRPDCLLSTGTYGHWITPVAKDLGVPNPNEIEPSLLETLSVGGSVNEKIKVKVYKA